MLRDLAYHFRRGDPVATVAVGLLILVAVGFLVYASSFGNRLFWDDDDFFLKNSYVHEWRYFPRYFSENVIAGTGLNSNYWRPVLLTAFALEWHLWDTWAPGWHVTNTFFHVADAVLLFGLLLVLFRRRGLALITALVFLVHPAQTEAVSYANSLGDSLSVFFMLCGALFYHQARTDPKQNRWAFWAGAFLAYPLALGSKETAIIYPALLWLMELYMGRGRSWVRRFLEPVRRLWPWLLAAGGYILLRATALNFQNTFNLYNAQNAFTQSVWVRLLTFCRSLVTYVTLIFWPAELHMERSQPFVTALGSDPLTILGIILLVGLAVLILFTYRRLPEISFGAVWFLIGLAPTSNIAVPINGVFYEHWLYLPLAGASFAIFSGLTHLGKIIPPLWTRRIGAGALAVILVALATRTVLRNREWRDPITFYNQTLRYSPGSYRIWNNLGMAYADSNQPTEAERAYRQAIQLDPTVAVAFHNLGNLKRGAGDYPAAEENYRHALELDPDFLFTYPQLAEVYYREGKCAEAEAVLANYAARAAQKQQHP
ncbi:MAG: tetratricopeptide repeat protein [Candidatus Liptonbacteria bacterium]|nr:tetratricopeptide repeat protein [Candidatus Liptonbacteria bacterium]